MTTVAVPGSSSKVVGCVGCEVKCFNRLTNEMLPATQYDGGKQKLDTVICGDGLYQTVGESG